ncbi:uncharacterized protein LOC143147920 [Ptiloglossa arizonensis]|uniref:uncharacterized protein LOC143147920 n=1 Tax=Ptiloglossa arizonensis TaxID=3350558 RepID=UPI003F9F6FC7
MVICNVTLVLPWNEEQTDLEINAHRNLQKNIYLSFHDYFRYECEHNGIYSLIGPMPRALNERSRWNESESEELKASVKRYETEEASILSLAPSFGHPILRPSHARPTCATGMREGCARWTTALTQERLRTFRYEIDWVLRVIGRSYEQPTISTQREKSLFERIVGSRFSTSTESTRQSRPTTSFTRSEYCARQRKEMEGNMMNKKTALTIQQKLDIVRKLDSGTTVSQITREYSIHSTTVRRIQRNTLTLHRLGNQGALTRTKKKLRRPQNEELENQLYKWFIERKALGDPVSDRLLQKQAQKMSRHFAGTKGFKASMGWLAKFKIRHDIRLVHNIGGKGSANVLIGKDFPATFACKIEEEEQEDIQCEDMYNMNVTGLAWQVIPTKTLVDDENQEVATEQQQRRMQVNTDLKEETHEEGEERRTSLQEDVRSKELEKAFDVLKKYATQEPRFVQQTIAILQEYFLERRT